MATRQVLADLVAGFAQQTGQQAAIDSVGGVDAAKRVAAGEAFDVVILASDAINKLLAAGHLLPGSKVDWVHSGVAVAVPAGARDSGWQTEARAIMGLGKEPGRRGLAPSGGLRRRSADCAGRAAGGAGRVASRLGPIFEARAAREAVRSGAE